MSDTPDPNYEAFMNLSCALLGLDRSVLEPRNTPFLVAKEYYGFLTQGSSPAVPPPQFASLLQTFTLRSTPPGSPESAAEAILADHALGEVARSIIKLWLLSTWYDPTDPGNFGKRKIISPIAYKEGLVWKVMQAHPFGYSMWTFGHWADDPPPLSAFLPKSGF